jgi:hypothetical protein
LIVATNKSNEQFACDDEVTNEVVVNFYVLRAGMEDRIGRCELLCGWTGKRSTAARIGDGSIYV